MWKCAAYKNSITIFSNGIAPCCLISESYRKPLTEIGNREIFKDLQTGTAPPECIACTRNENNNLPSYRSMFNSAAKDNGDLQFVDVRNTNLCNLKCRSCGPQFSSQWASELGTLNRKPNKYSLDNFKSDVVKSSVHSAYFTGGEPFLNDDHWSLLQAYVDAGYSKNINLRYNTNLTTLKYKDISIVDLWLKFKSVEIQCSLDATGEPFNYLRSGTTWEKVESNLEYLQNIKNLKISIALTLSNLNLWFLSDTMSYFKNKGILVKLNILHGPDYLSISTIPDELTNIALDYLDLASEYLTPEETAIISSMIINNNTQSLFLHTLAHILLLDKIRSEKLFDLLPFGEVAKKIILNNNGQ
jgi:sulfatase maturation enzyme AslB (radical SAM superfamily)